MNSRDKSQSEYKASVDSTHSVPSSRDPGPLTRLRVWLGLLLMKAARRIGGR